MIVTSPTTHVERPDTIFSADAIALMAPRKFLAHIMKPEVSIEFFGRKILHEFMLQCFESPFDGPTVDVRRRMCVKVEMVHAALGARQKLAGHAMSPAPKVVDSFSR